jgi:hypothetical protein
MPSLMAGVRQRPQVWQEARAGDRQNADGLGDRPAAERAAQRRRAVRGLLADHLQAERLLAKGGPTPSERCHPIDDPGDETSQDQYAQNNHFDHSGPRGRPRKHRLGIQRTETLR